MHEQFPRMALRKVQAFTLPSRKSAPWVLTFPETPHFVSKIILHDTRQSTSLGLTHGLTCCPALEAA